MTEPPRAATRAGDTDSTRGCGWMKMVKCCVFAVLGAKLLALTDALEMADPNLSRPDMKRSVPSSVMYGRTEKRSSEVVRNDTLKKGASSGPSLKPRMMLEAKPGISIIPASSATWISSRVSWNDDCASGSENTIVKLNVTRSSPVGSREFFPPSSDSNARTVDDPGEESGVNRSVPSALSRGSSEKSSGLDTLMTCKLILWFASSSRAPAEISVTNPGNVCGIPPLVVDRNTTFCGKEKTGAWFTGKTARMNAFVVELKGPPPSSASVKVSCRTPLALGAVAKVSSPRGERAGRWSKNSASE
mmetsp:Transcript_11646/g.27446  ORF Transcript_11646/g.27446 Transcript_11646/m.27446 type:complete len:303 (-) Transcript_11646:110-1018(-)